MDKEILEAGECRHIARAQRQNAAFQTRQIAERKLIGGGASRHDSACRLHGVEFLGIEAPADPLERALVIFVFDILQAFDEIPVSRGPAYVFRGASPLAFHADRIATTRLGSRTALEENLVRP